MGQGGEHGNKLRVIFLIVALLSNVKDECFNSTIHFRVLKSEKNSQNQRTNGPVNAHLGLVKHKTYKTWKIYGKEVTLTFNTHIPS